VEYEYAIKGVSRADGFNPIPSDSAQSSDVARIMEWVEVSKSFQGTEDSSF
jgi:hypothetical protein